MLPCETLRITNESEVRKDASTRLNQKFSRYGMLVFPAHSSTCHELGAGKPRNLLAITMTRKTGFPDLGSSSEVHTCGGGDQIARARRGNETCLQFQRYKALGILR